MKPQRTTPLDAPGTHKVTHHKTQGAWQDLLATSLGRMSTVKAFIKAACLRRYAG
jgi:hypothetical protein